MTLMSEKDLRMSSRVVVVKDRTFWVEFSATLCSTAWTDRQRDSERGHLLRVRLRKTD